MERTKKTESSSELFVSLLSVACNDRSAKSQTAARAILCSVESAASCLSGNMELLYRKLVDDGDSGYNFINNLLPDEAEFDRKKGNALRLFRDLYSGRLESLENL
jgi:hypothetical protein